MNDYANAKLGVRNESTRMDAVPGLEKLKSIPRALGVLGNTLSEQRGMVERLAELLQDGGVLRPSGPEGAEVNQGRPIAICGVADAVTDKDDYARTTNRMLIALIDRLEV